MHAAQLYHFIKYLSAIQDHKEAIKNSKRRYIWKLNSPVKRNRAGWLSSITPSVTPLRAIKGRTDRHGLPSRLLRFLSNENQSVFKQNRF